MLELRHIKKSYDHVTILEDINLKIQDEEIVSILEPSGCGKTTLLNLVLGLTPADQGQILFDGKDITNVPMEERGFNIVFQDYALFPNLNVYKNITYGLRNKPLSALDGVIKESIKEKIKEIARDFHLTTIIVTHDSEEALTLSDKVLIVNQGHISQYGAPEEIITAPSNNFVKEFILNQLEIKRNNIFALFHQNLTNSVQAV